MSDNQDPIPPVPDFGRPKLPTSAEWKRRCKERLAELKNLEEPVLQAHVAAKIGCSSSHITQTLAESRQETSDIVRELSYALGVDLPRKAYLMLRLQDFDDDDPILGSVADILRRGK